MNLDIFKISDPSGRMSKESYLFKNHKEEYDYILEYCQLKSIFNVTFKEKVYLCLNKMDKVPNCQNPNCQKKVNFKNSTIGYLKYCSNKCISSDPNIKKIKEEKSLEKFGTKSPAQSDIIKKKIIETNQEKWGGNSPMCSNEIKEKSKSTLMINWGVDSPAKSKEILEKRIESFKKSNYKETFKNTSLKRYGVEHPWQKEEIHNKSIINSQISKNMKLMRNILEKIKYYNEYKLVDINYNIIKRKIIIWCNNCNSNFEINREDFHIRHKNKTTICLNCNPINTHISGTEMKVLCFIKDLYKGEIITNTKSIIYPKELDIYLPELKLAFEFNGLYWHSEQQKGKNYHYQKMKSCRDKGIHLVNIWEDDWVYKTDILKSIISNKLLKNNNKFFARKCVVKEIFDIDLTNEFLEKNHILGKAKSKVKIGLYIKGELISIMCFSKEGNEYELVRFCNKINTTVVGSSSKLFNHFIKKYKPNRVISFSDNSMFDGNIYKSLNFRFERETPINYKWVIDKKRCHKSNYRKDRLVKLGYDKNKSESEIMIEDIGAYKVWDCGLKKWIFESERID